MIITYYWPPSGGPGVQRWLKWVQYFSEFGLQPVVLTVDPAKATYPVLDLSLEKEVPEKVKIFTTSTQEPYAIYKWLFRKKNVPYSGFTNEKTETFMSKVSRFIRGNIFIPDARKGWNKIMVKKAISLIKEYGIETVITTSPPHSTQVAGLKIKKHFPGLNWIADLRDPWTDIFYYDKMMHLPPARRKDAELEKQVLVSADHVITVGDYLKGLFLNKLGPDSIARNHILSINNGFDPKDFILQARQHDNRKSEVFLLSYIGTMTAEYSLDTLLRVLKSIRNSSKPDIPIKMSITGSISRQQKQEIEQYVPVEFNTHVSHREAVVFMQSSSLLLLIIPRIKHNKGIITGKIFEYMASGRPILGIGPVDGDASQILSESQSGKMFDYDDFYGIYDYLISCINGTLVHSPQYDVINMWSRREQFRKLISLL